MDAAADVVMQLGPIAITRAVAITWGIMTVLGIFAFCVSTRFRVDTPGRVQVAIEGIVLAIEQAIAEVLPEHARNLLPFVGTLWIFLTVANLAGIVPGLTAPTGSFTTCRRRRFCCRSTSSANSRALSPWRFASSATS